VIILLVLMQALPVQKFPRVDAPGGMVHQLHAKVDRVCGNPVDLDRTALLAREAELETAAHPAHPPVALWVALGCARAALAGDGAMSRPGLLMVAGNSWATGAERALLRALAEDHGNHFAAEVLGLVALNDLEPDDLAAATAAIVRAVDAGVISPGALRACDELSLRMKNEATAQRCAMLGLAKGIDSTWHLIRLAQLSFRQVDTISGTKYFLGAVAAAHDSVARSEVQWHLQWFLSPPEQQALMAQHDSTRSRFVRDRLTERDVRDGRPPGARLAEHFSRLEFVEANFRLSLSRIARDGHGLVGSTPLNQWPPDKVRAFCEPGLIPALPFRDYSAWQDRIDDRGVIWLRYGKPDKRVTASPTCDSLIMDYDPSPDGHKPKVIATNVREIWRYDIDGAPLILNFEAEMFSGSVEATRLVTGVLGSYMCGVEQHRCNLATTSWGASVGGASPVSPEEIEALRTEDREDISVGTTRDDNSPRGDRNIALRAALHRFWDPLTGAPLALVTYALPIKDLSVQKGDDRRTALIDFHLRQWNEATSDWTDTSFARHFVLPDTSVKRPSLVGFAVLPSTSGVSAWSVVASQPDQRRGRSYDVTTAGLADGALALSDLVLGSEGQGVTWNLHNVAIPLAPTGSLDRHSTVSLYYQIRSAAERSALRTLVALYRTDGGVTRDSAAFQVSFDQQVSRGINEVAPTLDVSQLDRGTYRLEVRLMDGAGKILVRRSVALDLE
jgi:hypothetical protein